MLKERDVRGAHLNFVTLFGLNAFAMSSWHGKAAQGASGVVFNERHSRSAQS